MYVKGAPENIINLCSKHIVDEGETDMNGDEMEDYLSEVTKMAGNQLRCMSFAYAKMTDEEFK